MNMIYFRTLIFTYKATGSICYLKQARKLWNKMSKESNVIEVQFNSQVEDTKILKVA